jgi:hypothetical protein
MVLTELMKAMKETINISDADLKAAIEHAVVQSKPSPDSIFNSRTRRNFWLPPEFLLRIHEKR